MMLLWVLRTFPGNYKSKLKHQAHTWLKLLDPAQDRLLIASAYSSETVVPSIPNATWSLPKGCEDNHGVGLCCQEARAIVFSTNLTYDWAFFVDDDVYARPELVRQVIGTHAATHGNMAALGTTGCVTGNFLNQIHGFCGGGGYALSRAAIEHMLAKPNFEQRYHRHCKRTQFCDITTAALAVEAGVALMTSNAFHPWGLDKSPAKVEALIREGGVATLHYYGGKFSDKFQGYTNAGFMRMVWVHELFKRLRRPR